jgi:poly(A) polymerase
VPRRFTQVTREIWELQHRLEQRSPKNALRLLAHPRFRAAYDFLLLRHEAGEPIADVCDWWTKFQTEDPSNRSQLLTDLPSPARKRRRRRRRRDDPAGSAPQ